MNTFQVLDRYASYADLSSEIKPFDKNRDLASALSEAPFLMAPMAGVSDKAYRLMARAAGASLAYTEMVSVAGIHFKSDKTWDLVIPDEAEGDIAVQLFGSKPEQFEEAASLVQKRLGSRLALIDINMACPVPKVVKKGEGSALMETPELASEIVKATSNSVDVPTTVKIRAGRYENNQNAAEFAKLMQDSGASAVAVHGRYATQFYTGTSNTDVVKAVVDSVDVPVIASGDMDSATSCIEKKAYTGATAVFCARGTYGNPWIFKDAYNLTQGIEVPTRTIEQRMAAFCCHVRLLEATGAHMARARSLAGWYFKGIPGAAAIRGRAVYLNTADEFCSLAEEVLAIED